MAGDNKDRALSQLRGVLIFIERSKEPPVKVLETVKGIVGDATALLEEPDPLKRKCFLLLAVLVEATKVEEHATPTGMQKVVRVTNRDLYNWVVEQAHEIVEEQA